MTGAEDVRRLRVPADAAAFGPWQTAGRERLAELLAIADRRPDATLTVGDPGPGPRIRAASFERRGTTVPCWLVRPPPDRDTGAGVVAVAGHGPGIDSLVDADDAYHRGLALKLADAGCTVLCPELRSFGRRRTSEAVAEGRASSSCQVDATMGLLTGRPVLGDRVGDAMAAVSALARLPGVHPRRIAVLGGSGGGAVALLAAALDQRIAAAVVGTYFSSFAASICSVPHCICNSVPGLLSWFEMTDLAALVLPRPLILEAGEQDPIFPIAATRTSHAELVGLCSGMGFPAPRLIVTDRGHEFEADEAIERLAAALGPIPYGS
ncbi:alpha/beta hydrolase family protein [Microlunatus ginsengisoli]|uniref:Dienelactone hydrolase family protein n=1 Tax=Microlunatus ginsengisoli TaxID=363863 RepID=A0ABP6ZXJ5_9ACTN